MASEPLGALRALLGTWRIYAPHGGGQRGEERRRRDGRKVTVSVVHESVAAPVAAAVPYGLEFIYEDQHRELASIEEKSRRYPGGRLVRRLAKLRLDGNRCSKEHVVWIPLDEDWRAEGEDWYREPSPAPPPKPEAPGRDRHSRSQRQRAGAEAEVDVGGESRSWWTRSTASSSSSCPASGAGWRWERAWDSAGDQQEQVPGEHEVEKQGKELWERHRGAWKLPADEALPELSGIGGNRAAHAPVGKLSRSSRFENWDPWKSDACANDAVHGNHASSEIWENNDRAESHVAGDDWAEDQWADQPGWSRSAAASWHADTGGTAPTELVERAVPAASSSSSSRRSEEGGGAWGREGAGRPSARQHCRNNWTPWQSRHRRTVIEGCIIDFDGYNHDAPPASTEVDKDRKRAELQELPAGKTLAEVPPAEQLAAEELSAEPPPAEEATAQEQTDEEVQADDPLADAPEGEDLPAHEVLAEEPTTQELRVEESQVEHRPAEEPPTQERLAHEWPGEKPTVLDLSAEALPIENRSADELAAEETTALEPPEEGSPSEVTPAGAPPAEERSADEMAAGEPTPQHLPTEEAPALDLSVEESPTEAQPAHKPPAEDPTAREPLAEKTPAEDPPAEAPPTMARPADEPLVEEPTAGEPPTEGPPPELPPADALPAVELPVGELASDELTVQELPAEEVPAEDLSLKESPTEVRLADESQAEEPTLRERPPEEIPVEEFTVEQSRADKRLAGELPADEPTAHELPKDEKLRAGLLEDALPAEERSMGELPGPTAQLLPTNMLPLKDPRPDASPTRERSADDVPAEGLTVHGLPEDELLVADLPAEQLPATERSVDDLPAGHIPREELLVDELLVEEPPATELRAEASMSGRQLPVEVRPIGDAPETGGATGRWWKSRPQAPAMQSEPQPKGGASFAASSTPRFSQRRWLHPAGKAIEDLTKGSLASGQVTNVTQAGVWVNFGAVKDGFISSQVLCESKRSQPEVGDWVNDLIIGHLDCQKCRVSLQFLESVPPQATRGGGQRSKGPSYGSATHSSFGGSNWAHPGQSWSLKSTSSNSSLGGATGAGAPVAAAAGAEAAPAPVVAAEPCPAAAADAATGMAEPGGGSPWESTMWKVQDGSLAKEDKSTLQMTRVRLFDGHRSTGSLHEWKGRYGWIRPDKRVEHPAAVKHGGRVFVHKKDLDDVAISKLHTGVLLSFATYADNDGIGASKVRLQDDDRPQASIDDGVGRYPNARVPAKAPPTSSPPLVPPKSAPPPPPAKREPEPPWPPPTPRVVPTAPGAAGAAAATSRNAGPRGEASESGGAGGALPLAAEVQRILAAAAPAAPADWRAVLGLPAAFRLGPDADAGLKDVKHQYRQLMRRLHPDKRCQESVDLAGGRERCDLALQLVQEAVIRAEKASQCWVASPAVAAPQGCGGRPGLGHVCADMRYLGFGASFGALGVASCGVPPAPAPEPPPGPRPPPRSLRLAEGSLWPFRTMPRGRRRAARVLTVDGEP